MMSRGRSLPSFAVLVMLAALCGGCRPDQKMADQPRYNPLEPSDFFADGMSARPQVAGTIARDGLKEDSFFYTAKIDGQLVESFPFTIDQARMERGRQRYNIYCSMCHGSTGMGDGMIVRRGYRRPPSL